MANRNTTRALALIAAAFLVVTMLIIKTRAQSPLEGRPARTTPVEPSRAGISGEQLFDRK
jgi:hypothetical protein